MVGLNFLFLCYCNRVFHFFCNVYETKTAISNCDFKDVYQKDVYHYLLINIWIKMATWNSPTAPRSTYLASSLSYYAQIHLNVLLYF